MTFLRNLALSGAALLALTACMEVPENAIVVDQQGADRLASITKVSDIMPTASASAMVQSLGKYCVPYAGDLYKTRLALKQGGYVSIGKQRHGTTNIELFVSDDGRPLVGIGRESGEPAACMTLRPQGSGLAAAPKGYVTKYYPEHGYIPAMETPSGTAKNI